MQGIASPSIVVFSLPYTPLQMTVRVGKLTVRVASDEAILLDAAAGASSSRAQSASSILSHRARQQRTPAKRSGGRTYALGGQKQRVHLSAARTGGQIIML